MDRSIPDLSDPALSIWTLSWGAHALLSQPLHLFDANIFWPHPLTWAYTDNLLVLVVPFALVRLFGGSWALALNFTTLLVLTLSQAFTYLLAYWLTHRRDAAVLAAIAFTFSSFLFAHLVHVQLLLYGLFPLCFYLLFRMLEERRLRWAALLGAANVATLTGSLYYAAIYVVVLIAISALWLVHHRRELTREVLLCFLIVGAVTALAIPTLLPYQQLQQERPLIPQHGLKAADLVTVSPGSVLYPGLDHAANTRGSAGGRTEHTFFPGFSVALLALIGLAALVLRGRRSHAAPRRRGRSRAEAAPIGRDRDASWSVDDPIVSGRREYVWLLVVGAAVAMLLALGPEIHGVTMPFTFFHDHVPGFEDIRVASRLEIPALLTGAVLAAIGFSWLTRRLPARTATLVAVVLGAFMLLEFAAPTHTTELPTGPATLAVYRELAHRPPGAVVELPAPNPQLVLDGTPAEPFVEAPRMVYGTLDWHPRFNGYSGNFPADYFANGDALNSFPSRAALDTARRLQLRYVILHTGTLHFVVYTGTYSRFSYPQYTDAQAQAIVAHLPSGATARRYGNSWLIDLGARSRS
ncbi:MAG TPA: hypothetical protein VGU73_10995 [Acidimicrobiia bacterium]|nr:hypothetical protein [Acidimicrobiia bacterium]